MRTRLHRAGCSGGLVTRAGYQGCRSRLGGGRRARRGLGSISVALLLSFSLAACGSSATSSTSATKVVPVTGTVAGNGYGYWLQRAEQVAFSSPAALSREWALYGVACATLTSTNGQRVGVLIYSSPGTSHGTCSEPAGRPLYVPQVGYECSTFAGDHLTFGTSDQQLILCARKAANGWKGVKMSATVDGKPVNLWKLLAATGAYPVQARAGNPVGVPSGSGRSAAYAPGLLLTGLAKGTHVIHSVFGCSACVRSDSWDVTYTVHVD